MTARCLFAGVLNTIGMFFELRTNDLAPRLFPELWTLACEYGWEGLVKNLESFAFSRERSTGRGFHDGLEKALSNMSSRGATRAASSLVAISRHATSSLCETHRLYCDLRQRISDELKNFLLSMGTYVNIHWADRDKQLVEQRASEIIIELHQQFPELK